MHKTEADDLERFDWFFLAMLLICFLAGIGAAAIVCIFLYVMGVI